MSDIQRARDVLAGWRAGATPGSWEKRGVGYVFSDHESPRTRENGYIGTPIVDAFMWPEGGESNLALITLTAGNPELLDAIDGLLVTAALYDTGNGLRIRADRIAAAIIAADERMSA